MILRHSGELADGDKKLTMVDLDYVLGKAEAAKDAVHQYYDFGVGADTGDANRISVTLPELAVAAALGALAAEYRRDMVALEGEGQLAFVLSDDARQRHGQVIAHRQWFARAAAMLGGEDELFGVFAIFSEERVLQFKNWRVDGFKAEAVKLVGYVVDNIVAPQHGIRQEVTKAFWRARRDELAHQTSRR